jgi:hypothetical protein
MNNMSSNTLDRWMDNTPGIYKLRVDELILPGTHDSGSDKQAPKFLWPNEVTQDVSIAEQINQGFRVLDLRVEFFAEQAAEHAKRFQLYHLTSSGRTIAGDVLDVFNVFYADPARKNEIIILNFHEFKNFTEAAHEALRDLIYQKIGGRLIDSALRHLTLGQLREQFPGRNVVVSYNRHRRHYSFWAGVEQQWIGTNYVSTSTLKTFMDEASAKTKAPYALRSIQCAKYSGLYVPDDFSDKVDLWFHSKNRDSYIQGFHIINTDWSTRSKIVLNCAIANQFRGNAKG